jgi:hypothetical protein
MIGHEAAVGKAAIAKLPRQRLPDFGRRSMSGSSAATSGEIRPMPGGSATLGGGAGAPWSDAPAARINPWATPQPVSFPNSRPYRYANHYLVVIERCRLERHSAEAHALEDKASVVCR